jgi:hypothetical protein
VLTIQGETVIKADPASVWRAWRPAFPMRPPGAESKNLDLYDLGGGLEVPVTLVAVNEMEGWTVEHALPGGRLVIDHRMTALGGGRVRVNKRFDVHGPMSVVYRLFLSGRIRKAMPEAFARLERDANG